MPRATMLTTSLVLASSHGGRRVWPCMYMVERMKATMKVKKAMPTIARANGRERNSVRMLCHNG